MDFDLHASPVPRAQRCCSRPLSQSVQQAPKSSSSEASSPAAARPYWSGMTVGRCLVVEHRLVWTLEGFARLCIPGFSGPFRVLLPVSRLETGSICRSMCSLSGMHDLQLTVAPTIQSRHQPDSFACRHYWRRATLPFVSAIFPSSPTTFRPALTRLSDLGIRSAAGLDGSRVH